MTEFQFKVGDKVRVVGVDADYYIGVYEVLSIDDDPRLPIELNISGQLSEHLFFAPDELELAT